MLLKFGAFYKNVSVVWLTDDPSSVMGHFSISSSHGTRTIHPQKWDISPFSSQGIGTFIFSNGIFLSTHAKVYRIFIFCDNSAHQPYWYRDFSSLVMEYLPYIFSEQMFYFVYWDIHLNSSNGIGTFHP